MSKQEYSKEEEKMENINEYNRVFYNEQYYNSGCGVDYHNKEFWQEGFSRIADQIIVEFHPSTLLDIGCAFGYLVAALRDRGVEAYGLDVSEYAISQVREDIRPFCHVGSVLEPLPEVLPDHFSLLTCIEVAEHLKPDETESFIEKVCSYSDRIIFSSTSDDIEEPTHFNVHSVSYWQGKFFASGFWYNYALKPYYISPQCLFFYRPKDVTELWINYEQLYQYEGNSHQKELDVVLTDRAKAQEVMDAQAVELIQLRTSYSVLEADRVKAQEVMDAQAAELIQLRTSYSVLEADRVKAQEVMDAQAAELIQLRTS